MSDIGTKSLPGRRVRMLLFLMGFTNEWDDLGRFEFEEEKAKKEARERLRSIRKVVHSQVLNAKESPNSTLMNQMAKRLLRLTLGALLVEETEALGPSSDAQCYVVAEQSSTRWSWTVFFLSIVVLALTG